MLLAVYQITLAPENQREFIQTVRPLVARVRRETGCLSCRVWFDADRDNELLLTEQWKTEEDLETHMRSDTLGILMGAIDLLGTRRNIQIHEIARTRDEETIRGLRGKG